MCGWKPLAQFVLSNRTNCCDSIESGHLDVHENAAECAASCLVSRNSEKAICSGHNRKLLLGDVGGQELEIDRVVIDNEERCDVCV